MRRMIIGLAAMSIGFIAMISQATAKATPAPSQTLISQPTETLQTTEMKLLKKNIGLTWLIRPLLIRNTKYGSLIRQRHLPLRQP